MTYRAVLDAVAGILVNKGIVLVTAQRNEEALAVWDEIERRFGNGDEPEILKQVASALVSKGTTLVHMNRAEDAVGVWSDVVRRFGEADASLYHEEIATAVLNSVVVLGSLNRPVEALEVCDEALRRFRSSGETYSVEAVAQTLVNKGSLLVGLDRTEEGFAAWDEVVRRFEASDVPPLRDAAESALCMRAQHELSEGRARTTIALLDRALLQAREGIPDSRLQGHMIRAPGAPGGRRWRSMRRGCRGGTVDPSQTEHVAEGRAGGPGRSLGGRWAGEDVQSDQVVARRRSPASAADGPGAGTRAGVEGGQGSRRDCRRHTPGIARPAQRQG